METRNRVGIGLSYRPPGYIGWRGIDSLKSIPGLLKGLQIRALSSSEEREAKRNVPCTAGRDQAKGKQTKQTHEVFLSGPVCKSAD
jgi:hypothetical protein